MAKRIRHKTERNRSYPGCWYYENADGDRTYYCRYKNKIGEVQQEKCGKRSQGYSLKKCSEKRADLMRGKVKSRKQERAEVEKKKLHTLGYLYKLYHEKNNGKGRDDSRFIRWLQPYWKNMSMTEMRNTDIQKYRKWLEEQENARGGKLSPQSVKHCLALLRRILKTATRHNDSFVLQATDFAIPRVENETTEELSNEDVEMLLHVLRTDKGNPQVCAMMLLIFYTGMRRGEVLKLTWEHVDFIKEEILLKESKGGVDVIIPMSSEARKVLIRQRENRLKSMELRNSGYVFPGLKGEKRAHIDRQARRIRDLAGLPKDFRPCHGLRHHFGSELAAQGVEIHLISELLGHKSLSVTMRYIKGRDNQKRAAVELMKTGGEK